MPQSRRGHSRPARGEEPAPASRGAAASDDLPELLDQLDAALDTSDRERVPAILERLFERRKAAPEVIVQRLVAGRALFPEIWMELLGGFAGRRASTLLRRVAMSAEAPDLVRFAAQQRVGWPETGAAKRRRTFLQTLKDGEATLIEATRRSMEMWPPQVDALEEVVGYLAALPSERRCALTERAVEEAGEPAVWLLHALLHVPDAPTQRVALRELVRLGDRASAGPIGRLVATSRTPEIRREAESALQGLRPQADDQPRPPAPMPALEAAYLSLIDGDGGQLGIVVRSFGPESFVFADFLFKDQWGVKSVLGQTHTTTDRLDDVLSGLNERGVLLNPVELPVLRGAVRWALSRNAVTGLPLPPEFELWEPFLHDAYPPEEADDAITPELDDRAYAGRPDLIRASGRLIDHPFFENWGFEHADILSALFQTPVPSGGRLTDRQYRPMIERLFGPDVRARFRDRLRRQAWLLEAAGDARERDLALAVAAHLATASPAELTKLPFLRRIIDQSLAQTARSMAAFGPRGAPPFGDAED